MAFKDLQEGIAELFLDAQEIEINRISNHARRALLIAKEKHRQYCKTWMREKRATDPEFRSAGRERAREYQRRRRQDPEYKKRQCEKQKERMRLKRQDPAFVEQEKRYQRQYRQRKKDERNQD